MPERTQVTSGWFHSQRRAHSAGLRRGVWRSIRALAFSGSSSTSRPPRSGSMMITGMPFSAAARSPFRPACAFSSI